MLDISWTELFVVAVVAILVIGPRDLPRTLRSVGNFVGQARRMAGDFQRQFDQALREAELDEVKKSIDSVRKADPRNQIRDAVKDVAGVGKNLKKDIESAGTGTTGAKSAGKSGADETAAAPAAKTPASKASAAKTPTAAKPATAKSAAAKSTPAKAPAKAATTKIAAAKTAKAPARKSTATAKKAAGTARSARAKSGSAAGATGSKTAPAKS